MGCRVCVLIVGVLRVVVCAGLLLECIFVFVCACCGALTYCGCVFVFVCVCVFAGVVLRVVVMLCLLCV